MGSARKRVAHDRREVRRQFDEARHVLARQRVVKRLAEFGRGRLGFDQRGEHARVAQIEPHFREAGQTQRVEHQLLDFQIRFETRVTVDFRADLDLLARGVQAARTRMRDVARIAKTRHALAIQQVRVDARDLRRDVRAQTERAPGQLIDELEGAQIQIVTAAGQQRLDVLEQRRHDHLVAVRAETVQQMAPQLFDLAGFRRQHVGNILGK